MAGTYKIILESYGAQTARYSYDLYDIDNIELL